MIRSAAALFVAVVIAIVSWSLWQRDRAARHRDALHNQSAHIVQSALDDTLFEPRQQNPGYVGPQACATCHAERVAEFQQTRHFKANAAPDARSMPAGFQPGHGGFRHPEASVQFEMTESHGRFLQTTLRDSAMKSPATSSEIAFVYGAAGGNDEVFFAWHNDRLTELPIVWLAPQQSWGASPLDRHGGGDYSREMTIRCVECHNTWFEHVPGSRNQYRREDLVPGVTCEVCHGPGREHVAFHHDHPQVRDAHAVVRPAQLSRERRMDLCAQCHSNALKHRGPAFQYRPGLPLDEFYFTPRTKHPEDDHVANQTEYLRQSKCFQKSETLTCVTCHNPHRPRSAGNAGAESCRTCHANGDCNDRHNLPVAVQDDCLGCHMPERRKIQVFFRTEQDQYVAPVKRYEHQIGIHPRARQSVLLNWYRAQSDPASRAEVTKIAAQLGESWLQECDRLQHEYRFLAAIDACRESLSAVPSPATKQRLQTLIELQSNIDTDYQDAQWHEREGRYPQAIAAFHRVLTAKPDDAMARAKLGTTYAVVGEKQLAIEHLQSAAAADPDDPYAHGMLGWLAHLDVLNEEALAQLQKADAVEPYSAKINLQMGLALMKLDRQSEAIVRFTKAITIDPKETSAVLGLSQASRRVGKSDEALKYAVRAARLSQFQDPEVLMNLAEVYFDQGQSHAAVQTAEQALAASQSIGPQRAAQIRIRLDELRTGRAKRR